MLLCACSENLDSQQAPNVFVSPASVLFLAKRGSAFKHEV